MQKADTVCHMSSILQHWLSNMVREEIEGISQLFLVCAGCFIRSASEALSVPYSVSCISDLQSGC